MDNDFLSKTLVNLKERQIINFGANYKNTIVILKTRNKLTKSNCNKLPSILMSSHNHKTYRLSPSLTNLNDHISLSLYSLKRFNHSICSNHTKETSETHIDNCLKYPFSITTNTLHT